ncbi:FAD-dependent monooxygenase [Diaphorobacter sp. MNS-0]|nr:FAD-dependent monooxygenase [Diaphorobacter sp. MNS-0]
MAVDVFVVGAGPTGLACAALLARQGVDILVIKGFGGTRMTCPLGKIVRRSQIRQVLQKILYKFKISRLS